MTLGIGCSTKLPNAFWSSLSTVSNLLPSHHPGFSTGLSHSPSSQSPCQLCLLPLPSFYFYLIFFSCHTIHASSGAGLGQILGIRMDSFTNVISCKQNAWAPTTSRASALSSKEFWSLISAMKWPDKQSLTLLWLNGQALEPVTLRETCCWLLVRTEQWGSAAACNEWLKQAM